MLSQKRSQPKVSAANEKKRRKEKTVADKGRERELAQHKCASNKCLFTI